jgi:hypothetical protein
MSRENVNHELQPDNRHLRLRIARLRRRIDGRLHSVERQGRKLTSWKTYARTYPGSALLVALGSGLALSAGLGKGRLTRLLGMRLFRRGAANLSNQFFAQLQRTWNDAVASPCSEESCGGDNEQA